MIALLGAGYWGKNHAKTLQKLGILVGYHDEQVTLDEGYSKFNSLSELLSSDKVQGVVIATPPSSHFQLARECIESGKHILVEKPICMNEKDAACIMYEAQKRNLIVSVGHLLLYHKGYIKLKEIIQSQAIGKIVKIKANRKFFGIRRAVEDVIWSLAPHDFAMISDLCGSDYQDLFCKKKYIISNKICDEAYISFRVDDIECEIELSWMSPEKNNKFEVIGTKGMLIFNDNNHNDKKLCQYDFDLFKDTLQKNVLEPTYFPLPLSSPLEEEIKDFAASIKESREPISNIKIAINVVKLLNAL